MNEIVIHGPIGSWWGDEGVSSLDVERALNGMHGEVAVRLNSPGGELPDGVAIYNMLRAHPGRVTVNVEGAAYSAASLIAMAGDEIVMLPGSAFLIHDPAYGFTAGRGTEDDHRKIADELARLSEEVASIYAVRTKRPIEEIRQMMRDEVVMVGREAVKAGFADRYIEADAEAAAVMNAEQMKKSLMALARRREESLGIRPGEEAVAAMMAGITPKEEEAAMPEKEKAAADMAAKGAKAAKVAADGNEGAGQPVGEKDSVTMKVGQEKTVGKADGTAAEMVAKERERSVTITRMAKMAQMPEVADELIAEGVSIADAVERIAEMRAKRDEAIGDATPGRGPARVTADERDKFAEGASLALMAKVGLKGGERNEFSSLSLAEMARASIEKAGGSAQMVDKRELVGRAFTMAGANSTSDFPNILQNVMGRAALQGWEEATETFEAWTRQGSLADFKPTKRVGVGVMEAMPEIPEGAEYTYGSVSDRGEDIALATYGRIIRITRQAIINDDLSILGDLPRKAGRAARRTIGNLVYAVLNNNPAMSDGTALFHADHNNLLTGASSALSVDALASARAAMRKQKDGGSALNIRPRYLLVPAALETAAQQIIASTVDPRDSKGHAMNPVSGMAEVIADARLDDGSSTAWFLTADPNVFDTIEVAYLDGNDAPYIEQENAWSADGVELKVRIDAGVAPLDWRTMLKAAGA